eukprot:15479547-Alexandrium_andersonii.AAC.1
MPDRSARTASSAGWATSVPYKAFGNARVQASEARSSCVPGRAAIRRSSAKAAATLCRAKGATRRKVASSGARHSRQ